MKIGLTEKQKADLRAARALIEAPDGWTTGVEARDIDQNPVRHDNPYASCFCANGAILRVVFDREASDLEAHDLINRLCALSNLKHGLVLFRVNDEIGKAAVLDLFDEAINDGEPA